jgi:hypothetical protein
MADWKDLVKLIAPTVATALGGPLAGVAVRALSEALLGRPDGTQDEIAAAINGATADDLVRIREADVSLQRDLAAAEIDLERILAEDRSSARQREISTGDTWTPRILAGVVTLGFFGVLVWLLAWGIPEAGGEALLVMLGSLGTAWTAIVSYYYGSSAGSRAKTEAIQRMAGR